MNKIKTIEKLREEFNRNIKPDYLTIQVIFSEMMTVDNQNQLILIDEIKKLFNEANKKLEFFLDMLTKNFPIDPNIKSNLDKIEQKQQSIHIYIDLFSLTDVPKNFNIQNVYLSINKILNIVEKNINLIEKNQENTVLFQEKKLINMLQTLNTNIEMLNCNIQKLNKNLQKTAHEKPTLEKSIDHSYRLKFSK